MALHNTRGKDGEMLAAEYLRKRGFDIKLCNWRSGRYEIDIIAMKDRRLHFIEVKTRHTLTYGFPEESVTRQKFNNMKNAAACFLSKFPGFMNIQFDILSVLRLKNKPVEYFLIEDVYM